MKRLESLDPDYLESVKNKFQANDFAEIEGTDGRNHLYRWTGKEFQPVRIRTNKITGMNTEHVCFQDLMCDNSVNIINLFGPAGSGKTFMAMGMSIDAIFAERQRQIIIVRELVPATEFPMGFLPGSADEKTEPMFAAVFDTFDALAKHSNLFHRDPLSEFNKMQGNGAITLSTLETWRGRSIEDAIIICDDAQNLSIENVRLIITRASKNTKIIFNGDLSQIDNSRMKGMPGIKYIDQFMYGHPSYANIEFTHSECRSQLVKVFIEREQAWKARNDKSGRA